MEVSKNSWHFQTASIVFKYPSHSLCVYFWQVVLSLIAVPLLMIVGVAFFLGLVALFLFPLWQSYVDAAPVGVASAAVWLLAGVIVRSVMLEKAYHYDETPWWAHEIIKPKKSEKLSLLRAYIRAKHEKVCPHIDFK